MSYIDEKVNFLVDDLGGSILTALEQNGLDNYIQSVRTALADYSEDFANVIRESFRNGLTAGRKRAFGQGKPSQKPAGPKKK